MPVTYPSTAGESMSAVRVIASYGVTVTGPDLKTSVCTAASAAGPKANPTAAAAASSARRRMGATR